MEPLQDISQAYGELLAHLSNVLLSAKPDDVLSFLIDVLTFPFAPSPHASFHHAKYCDICCAHRTSLRSVSSKSCCSYIVTGPLPQSCEQWNVALPEFLNSSANLLVIVGDEESKCLMRRECDCFGSGGFELAQWLKFPGAFIHGRKVLELRPSNAQEFARAVGGMTQSVSGTQGGRRSTARTTVAEDP